MTSYLFVVYNYPSDHSGWQVVDRIFEKSEDALIYAKENDGEYIKKYELGTNFDSYNNEDIWDKYQGHKV